jgi:hypothetical protein
MTSPPHLALVAVIASTGKLVTMNKEGGVVNEICSPYDVPAKLVAYALRK